MLSIVFFLLIGGTVVSVIGTEEVVVGEKLCVDGDGDINLEGFKCEETELRWFGMDDDWAVIPLIPAVIFAITFMILAGRDLLD